MMKDWISIFLIIDNGWEIKERLKTLLLFVIWVGVVLFPIMIMVLDKR